MPRSSTLLAVASTTRRCSSRPFSSVPHHTNSWREVEAEAPSQGHGQHLQSIQPRLSQGHTQSGAQHQWQRAAVSRAHNSDRQSQNRGESCGAYPGEGEEEETEAAVVGDRFERERRRGGGPSSSCDPGDANTCMRWHTAIRCGVSSSSASPPADPASFCPDPAPPWTPANTFMAPPSSSRSSEPAAERGVEEEGDHDLQEKQDHGLRDSSGITGRFGGGGVGFSPRLFCGGKSGVGFSLS